LRIGGWASPNLSAPPPKFPAFLGFGADIDAPGFFSEQTPFALG
jgi:hypothetical protein